jgi:SAM-dependent methyltransferase
MLKSAIRSALNHPLTRGLDLDSPETTLVRFRLIKQKSFLRKFYQDCYISIAHSLASDIGGPILELGSGGGFIKEQIPQCITSEILQVPGVDIILDGQKLPLGDATLAAIVMFDVFHHVPRVRLFLREAARCVKPGGVVVMFEPWNTPWSRLIYQYFHHETFDPEYRRWGFSKGAPLSGANSALPWMVFERDRDIFEREFPEWEIEGIQLQAPFRYLLSGGVAYRSLVPGQLYNVSKKIERLVQPWLKYLAMFAVVILKRRMP